MDAAAISREPKTVTPHQYYTQFSARRLGITMPTSRTMTKEKEKTVYEEINGFFLNFRYFKKK